MGPFEMFGSENDPDRLGIGLKSRARRQRMSQDPRENFGRHIGPAPDPMWEGFFQALQEAGVDRVADNSVGEARGMFSENPRYAPTFDPLQGQSSAVASASPQMDKQGMLTGVRLQTRPTNALGASPSVDALYRVMGEQRPQGPVSTTGQSKLRVREQRGGSKA